MTDSATDPPDRRKSLGIHENTEVTARLLEEVIRLRVWMEEEREEEKKERSRAIAVERNSRRLAVTALATSIVVIVIVLVVFGVWVRGREQDQCESTNRARMGNREAQTIATDELFALAQANPNPHSPRTNEELERLRQQMHDRVQGKLRQTQPIVDCG